MKLKLITTLGILVILALLINTTVYPVVTSSIILLNDEEDEEEEDEEKVKCKKRISTEEAIQIAINELNERYGTSNYTVIKVELEDNKYEIKLTNKTHEFEVKINACNGKIIEIEIKQLIITPTKPKETIINSTAAIKIALNFLKEQFGDKNYTVFKIELKNKIYEIKITDNVYMYEFKIDAYNGNIINFEIEKIELKVDKKIERKNKIETKIKEKFNSKGFEVEIEKEKPKLKLEYLLKENQTVTELELRLVFNKLIEFIDNGYNSSILDKNDTIIQEISLQNIKWITTISNTTSENGTLISIIITQIAFINQNTQIIITYHITPSVEILSMFDQNITVKIWKVKFDIYIENFAWKNDETMLALLLKFNNEFEYKNEKDLEISFKRFNNVTPFFNWGGDAFKDGEKITINSRVENNKVYIIYPHFKNILKHDPEIGYKVYTKGILEEFLPTTQIFTPDKIKEEETVTVLTTPLLRHIIIGIITLLVTTILIITMILKIKRIKEELK